jgi:hypothetical protein
VIEHLPSKSEALSSNSITAKTENRTIIDSSNTGHIPGGMCSRIQQSHLHTIFISVLFIIAKVWKQPRSPSTDEWF